ncbi:hypothetical protein LTR37_014016 [Vermiconidia calcicola]|uniref:Uncharacterized protein n=1 Tax=Vermiconidia calcicola TaxID=1690605 RepID=A0ACC3MUV8_9PEZI|nr:hypothetical protein LTR37_014016 [Vermiconidia calcicola]
MSQSGKQQEILAKEIVRDDYQDFNTISSQPRYALPVPICRGARIVHLAAPSLPSHNPTCDVDTNQTLKEPGCHQGPSCGMQYSIEHPTVPSPRCKTSLLQSSALHHPKPPCVPRTEAKQEFGPAHNAPPIEIEVEVQARTAAEERDQDGCLERTGSKSYQTRPKMSTDRLSRDALPQTPVVVKRTFREEHDPFRKQPSLGRNLSVGQLQKGCPNGGPALESGARESGASMAAARSDKDKNQIKNDKNRSRLAQNLQSKGSLAQILYPNDDVDEAQRPRSVPSALAARTCQKGTASIMSTSNRQDTAIAAEQQERCRQAAQSIGHYTRPDITSWASIMERSTTLDDGSRNQSGFLTLRNRPVCLRSSLLQDHARSSVFSLQHPLHAQTDSILKQSRFRAQRQHHLLQRSVSSERLQAVPGMTITTGMDDYHSRRADPGGEVTSHDTLSGEVDEVESVPSSPSSNNDSDEEAYETPMTSPSRSPAKARPSTLRSPKLNFGLFQLDGQQDISTDQASSDEQEPDAPTAQVSIEEAPRNALLVGQGAESTSSDEDSIVREEEKGEASTHQRTYPDLSAPEAQTSRSVQPTTDLDDVTPLVSASPAKGAFPFPSNSDNEVSTPKRAASRHPSELLKRCERNASTRQRRLMTEGLRSPDRFIAGRPGTPTKEMLLLSKPRIKQMVSAKATSNLDPFGPVPVRSLRMAERFATVRSPPSLPRPVGMVGTRIQEGSSPNRRAASAGTVWTVGGSMVTEGVLSTSNGRGGRTTSGSNAPHYVADFLRKNSPSEEEVTHGKRLALAMDIDRGARMIDHSSSSSPTSSRSPSSADDPHGREWRDGAWQQDGVLTPTKTRTKKVKDVPVIPFRVLNAPALRDDFYCSLLSYSPTLQCLAVGLGPHVYLWSEDRGSKNIPDSLSAPQGSAHVTSVSFSSEEGGSAILAIGRADGRITLWSPLDRDPRFDSEQPSPVSCVCFRPTTVRRPSVRDPIAMVATEELLVGDEVGYVYYYSIEWPDKEQRDLFNWHGGMTLLARINCHSQQVCGLAWSPGGECFATGGNDNQLFLFNSKKVLRPPRHQHTNNVSAVHVRSESSSTNATITGQNEVLAIVPGAEKHIFALNAAVKAIAFASWQSTLIAAGGGSNDRCIHFFHTSSGASLGTIECHAQVTSLVFSEKRQEIASTFGFAQPEHPYRVAVFTWPGCNMVVKIPWFSEERALFAVAYPRGPRSGRAKDGTDASTSGTRAAAAEGQSWYGKRTRQEGCLVVATSDASIKFHEIWAEHSPGGGKRVASGVLGGSQILEEECSGDIARWSVIR